MNSSYPCYNRLMSLRLRRMARYGAIFKVLHADTSVVDATADTDMVLYVLYSLNKRKRWEIEWELCESYLESLQHVNSSMETMVLERCLTDPFRAHWSHIVPHFDFIMSGSKVKKMHCLPSNGPYSEQEFKGNGRFLNESRKKKNYEACDTEIITYNIVRAPRNYKKMFECDFRKYKREKAAHYHRKGEFDPRSTRQDWDEYELKVACYCCDNCEYGLDDDMDKEWTVCTLVEPPKYYNLLEHLVERRRGRRRPRNSEDFVLI